MRTVLAAIAVLMVVPAAAMAQRDPEPIPEDTVYLDPDTILVDTGVLRPLESKPAMGGVLGGALGALFGGVSVFILASSNCHSDGDCINDAVFLGSVAGETLLLPVGVQVASNPKPNFPITFATSAGLGGLAILAGRGAEGVMVPLLGLQLGVSVAVSRVTSR